MEVMEHQTKKKKAFQRIRKKTKALRDRMGTRIYVLPNLLTTGNIFFGFLSILQSIQGNFQNAAYCIVIAAVFDLLDGRVARLTRATSKFGEEYDSLCDLISFGMAPALLMYLWALFPFQRLGWIMAFFYLASTALRLARFNVQVNIASNTNFSGLPSPMAAGIVASSVLCFYDQNWPAQGSSFLLGMTFLLGFVMVSNFSYRSFKDVDFRKRLPFHYLVLAVLVFAVIALHPEVMLFVLFLTYALLGAIFGILRIGKQPRRNPYVGSQNHDEDEDLMDEDGTEDEEEHYPSH